MVLSLMSFLIFPTARRGAACRQMEPGTSQSHTNGIKRKRTHKHNQKKHSAIDDPRLTFAKQVGRSEDEERVVVLQQLEHTHTNTQCAELISGPPPIPHLK